MIGPSICKAFVFSSGGRQAFTNILFPISFCLLRLSTEEQEASGWKVTCETMTDTYSYHWLFASSFPLLRPLSLQPSLAHVSAPQESCAAIWRIVRAFEAPCEGHAAESSLRTGYASHMASCYETATSAEVDCRRSDKESIPLLQM